MLSTSNLILGAEVHICKKTLNLFLTTKKTQIIKPDYKQLSGKSYREGILFLKSYQEKNKSLSFDVIFNMIKNKFHTSPHISPIKNRRQSVAQAIYFLKSELQPSLFEELFPNLENIYIKETSFINLGISVKHTKSFPIIGIKNREQLIINSGPIKDYISFYNELSLKLIEVSHEHTSHVFFKSRRSPKEYAHFQGMKALNGIQEYYRLINKLSQINPNIKIDELIENRENYRIFSFLWNAYLQIMFPLKTFNLSSIPTEKGYHLYKDNTSVKQIFHDRYFRIYYLKWISDQGTRLLWSAAIITGAISLIDRREIILSEIEKTTKTLKQVPHIAKHLNFAFEQANMGDKKVEMERSDLVLTQMIGSFIGLKTIINLQNKSDDQEMINHLDKNKMSIQADILKQYQDLLSLGVTKQDIHLHLNENIKDFKTIFLGSEFNSSFDLLHSKEDR